LFAHAESFLAVFLSLFVHFVPFRGQLNTFFASFPNGTLQNGPATVDEASVDACIEQRFGQRRQSWLKTNQRQSALICV